MTKLLPGGGARFDRPSQTRQGGDQERRVIDALIAAAMCQHCGYRPGRGR